VIPTLSNLVLLADIEQVISALIALVVPLLFALRHIFGSAKPGEQPRKQAPQAQAPPQPQPQQPVAAGGQQADPLRSQVEEFLRRAGRAPQQAEGRRPAAQQRGAKPARASEIELLVDENARELPERRPLGQPLRPVSQPLSSPRQQQQRAASARTPRRIRQLEQAPRESVADHVAESIEAHSRAIGQQTSRLGQRIIEDDHQFDVQLKAKFDHSVGTLTGSAVTAAEQAAAAVSATQTPAAQIAAMLSSPDGVRQAMVVNEILRRPSERW
jgi:hypothetical protein